MKHIAQFKNLILDPTLKEAGLYSSEASDLLLGTALVESNLEYFKQLDDGPALGYFQMESATFQDIYGRYLNKRPELRIIVEKFIVNYHDDFSMTDPFKQTMTNLPFAILMARIKYLMIPAAIPLNADGQALYWKTYYNTVEGKGTIDKYLRKWREWKNYENADYDTT